MESHLLGKTETFQWYQISASRMHRRVRVNIDKNNDNNDNNNNNNIGKGLFFLNNGTISLLVTQPLLPQPHLGILSARSQTRPVASVPPSDKYFQGLDDNPMTIFYHVYCVSCSSILPFRNFWYLWMKMTAKGERGGLRESRQGSEIITVGEGIAGILVAAGYC